MQIIKPWQPKPIPLSEQTELITVAVAVYNIEPYLERAVDSILNQTYRNLEILLVDDGATDNSGAICDAYARKDPRVRVIHQKNGGLDAARNTGIEQATGTYIAFVDGDDWIDPSMYEHMLSAIREQDADLAVCRYRQVYEDGVKDASDDRLAVFEGQQILEQYLLEDEAFLIQNAGWNKLYKKSIIGDLRFPHCLYEDMLYTIQLLNRPAKSVYLDRAYYNYVCDRSGSIMNKGLNEKTFTDLIPNLYKRSAFLREIGREDLALVQDYFLYKRLMLFYTQVYRSKDEKKQQRLQFLEQKIREGKGQYEKIYSIPAANPHEYKKMKLFLRSVRLYNMKMEVNDRLVYPLKVAVYSLLERVR